MKTEYLLGLSIACLFVSAAFFFLARMETESVNRLRINLENASIESESARISLLLAQSFGEQDKYCLAINQRISSQLARNFSLVSQIDTANKETFTSDITQLKQKYFLSNAELYYYLKQSKQTCGQNTVLVLYFYLDAVPCADCYLQGKILDSIRAKCANFKVFSFPVDVDVETTSFFKSFFGITSAPAIVIDSKVLPGLQSEAQILREFKCEQ